MKYSKGKRLFLLVYNELSQLGNVILARLVASKDCGTQLGEKQRHAVLANLRFWSTF